MTWMTMSCAKCGKVADLDEWVRTPVGGELPHGTYQCPACRFAFERRQGASTVYPDGFVMPGPVTLVPVGGRL